MPAEAKSISTPVARSAAILSIAATAGDAGAEVSGFVL